MTVKMLKGKIHRAVVRQAELNYVGSITVDPKLMEAAPEHYVACHNLKAIKDSMQ